MSALYLGVDGGGTKTAFTLIDDNGKIVAQHIGGSSYYLQIGINGLSDVLADGIGQVCPTPEKIRFAFLGLPAFGEDSRVDPVLAALPRKILGHDRYLCGNDMVCGWAGSLGGKDGINIVAGTGSIGYGERLGKSARAGGWGELFSDEGSAYWIAIEGLRQFSRMSDGREPPGPLLDVFRTHFNLDQDLDICGRVMGSGSNRDTIAGLCPIVRKAAELGDTAAGDIFVRAAGHLAEIIHSIGIQLGFEDNDHTPVSYSGGIFATGDLVLDPFIRTLKKYNQGYSIAPPENDPALGAALYAKILHQRLVP